MLGILFGLVFGLATSAYAAHESNNRVEWESGDISGHAIVNFVAGNGGWRSTAELEGLPAGDYSFAVNLNGSNQTIVCTFTADGVNDAGCAADTDVPGFNTGVILDANGDIVVSGIFVRRGGNR